MNKSVKEVTDLELAQALAYNYQMLNQAQASIGAINTEIDRRNQDRVVQETAPPQDTDE